MAKLTKIKICGLRRKEDVVYANECKPDYIGFVFAKSSKRMVTKEKAKELKSYLDADITAVGVFVNAKIEEITQLYQEKTIAIAQLHGEEDEQYIAELREKNPGIVIIKAIKVATKEDVRLGSNMPAEYLLFDTLLSGQQGGTGKTFDWSLLEGVTKPFFLAGGIRFENVADAIADTHPYAVDVSSGVETDGYKDRQKMRVVIEAVRN